MATIIEQTKKRVLVEYAPKEFESLVTFINEFDEDDISTYDIHSEPINAGDILNHFNYGKKMD